MSDTEVGSDTKLSRSMGVLLKEATNFSGGDGEIAITLLMGTTIYLYHQLGISRKAFLKQCELQWDEIDAASKSEVH